MQDREFQDILQEIYSLPMGNITYKNIRGKRRMYLQWYEDGVKKSRYVRDNEQEEITAQVSRRKELLGIIGKKMNDSDKGSRGYVGEATPSYGAYDHSDDYEMRVVTGSSLSDMCKAVNGFRERDLMPSLRRYLNGSYPGRVCLIYGLRRTGKTTMVFQAISGLPASETAYIKALTSDNMGMLGRDLKRLSAAGIKYVFIDEVTLMSDFITSASLLSDVYAMLGMKLVLSGTDSLGLLLSTDDELYDRALTIHTTYISFSEYSRVLGICDIDEYIRYGGTFSAPETDFDDADLMDLGACFRDDESARRYVDTAIARNIQHSLLHYKSGGRFRHLIDLYEADELTSAINRVIEDMNHRFVLSVLERDFESHDLGSARQLDRKKKASMGLDSSLDGINTQEVVDRLRHILDIRNTDERNIKLTTDHVNEIKEYLYLLDLIVNCPVETIGADKPVEHIIFTQPGMRYCQAQALVHSLMKDEYFMSYPARERAAICDRILEEVRGRMLEEIVLLETMKSLPRNCRAFKLEFAIGEFDMVIFDQDRFETGIYEIKHTDKPAKEQCKHLLDKEKCAQVEHMYGTITSKYVLYRGENCSSYGVDYRNVEDFLKNSASI